MEKYNSNNNMGGRVSMLAITFCMTTTLSFYVANAVDPPPLQNFCIGVNDYKSSVFINGKFCKNPNDVTVDDFLYKGFNIPGNTSNNVVGAAAHIIGDSVFPGVNTLGISMGRIDFGPFGLNVPHLHPLGSEIFLVLEGTLYIGLVTTDNKLFDAVIGKGDVVVFPQGLIHFQLNLGNKPALAIASFGSQNPGRTDIATAVFGSSPLIFDDVLTKAFQVSERVIQKLQHQFVSDDDDDSVEKGRSLIKLMTEASYT